MSGRAILVGFGLVLLLTVGCGKRTYPIKGHVVFEDGTPAKELAGYLIMFQSKEHNASANGLIQADGSFSVGTFSEGDGALQGKQRIAIMPPPPLTDTARAPSLIHARYGSFDTSELEIEVKPDENELTIKVEKAKK